MTMPEKEEVARYIRRVGYATEKSIKEEYSSSNQEILDAVLGYLVDKNVVRRVTYRTPDGNEEKLYYLI